MVNLCLQSYTFCLEIILYLPFWFRIRIHKGPEYGSNLDPDPLLFTLRVVPLQESNYSLGNDHCANHTAKH